MKLTTPVFVFAIVLAFAFAPSSGAQALIVDCSGGGMFTDIQTAINASVNGDVIVVRPCGAGYSSGFVVNNRFDLQIVGAGAAAPTVVGAYAVGPGTQPNTFPQIFDNAGTCVEITDSQQISLVGLAFEHCGGSGINIVQSERVNLQGNALYNPDDYGVFVRLSSDISITGNYLANSKGPAGVFVGPNSRNVVIQNNRVLKNKVGIHALGNWVDILNNEVWGNVGSGIIVENGWSEVSRNTVLNYGSGFAPQIDYNAMPPGTCLIVIRSNFGIQPWGGGCQEENL